MLGMIWVASAAFDALIEALNIAYNLKDNRPFWKTRLLAMGLGAICGILLLTGLLVIILGPRFGDWLAAELDVPRMFASLWVLLHFTIAIVLTVLAVELLYFLAPCEHPKFLQTLPGAIMTVVPGWDCQYYWEFISGISPITAEFTERSGDLLLS